MNLLEFCGRRPHTVVHSSHGERPLQLFHIDRAAPIRVSCVKPLHGHDGIQIPLLPMQGAITCATFGFTPPCMGCCCMDGGADG